MVSVDCYVSANSSLCVLSYKVSACIGPCHIIKSLAGWVTLVPSTPCSVPALHSQSSA